jgi:hypothetical protein
MGAVAPEFVGAMKRLMGLKFAPTELTTHWEALRDLTPVELDVAVARAAKECLEFPAPRMLRMFVEEWRVRQPIPDEDLSREVPVDPRTITTPDGHHYTFTREWKYFCDECSDTGRRSYWCGDGPAERMPWLSVARCHAVNCEKLRRGGYGHEWVNDCPCAATNPDVLRRKARAQQVTRGQAER